MFAREEVQPGRNAFAQKHRLSTTENLPRRSSSMSAPAASTAVNVALVLLECMLVHCHWLDAWAGACRTGGFMWVLAGSMFSLSEEPLQTRCLAVPAPQNTDQTCIFYNISAGQTMVAMWEHAVLIGAKLFRFYFSIGRLKALLHAHPGVLRVGGT